MNWLGFEVRCQGDVVKMMDYCVKFFLAYSVFGVYVVVVTEGDDMKSRASDVPQKVSIILQFCLLLVVNCDECVVQDVCRCDAAVVFMLCFAIVDGFT